MREKETACSFRVRSVHLLHEFLSLRHFTGHRAGGRVAVLAINQHVPTPQNRPAPALGKGESFRGESVMQFTELRLWEGFTFPAQMKLIPWRVTPCRPHILVWETPTQLSHTAGMPPPLGLFSDRAAAAPRRGGAWWGHTRPEHSQCYL